MSNGGFGDASTNPEMAGNNLAMNAVPAISQGNLSASAQAGGGTTSGGGGVVSAAPVAQTAAPTTNALAATAVPAASSGGSSANMPSPISSSGADAASQAITSGLASVGYPVDSQSWYNGLTDDSKKSLADTWAKSGGQDAGFSGFVNNVYNAHVTAAFNPGMANVVDAAGIAPAPQLPPADANQPRKVATTAVTGAPLTELYTGEQPASKDEPVPGSPVTSPNNLVDAAVAQQYGLMQQPTQLKRGDGYDPSDPVTNSLVMQAQDQLRRAGYYTDGHDGLYGPLTQAAVAQYRKDNNLGSGGNIDAATMSHLNMNFPASGGPPTPPTKPGQTGAAAVASTPPSGGEPFAPGPNAQKAIDAEADRIMADAMKNVSTPQPNASAVIAKAEADDPFGSWMQGQDAKSMAAAAAAAGMNPTDYAKSVYYGHIPYNPLPAQGRGVATQPGKYAGVPTAQPTKGATISPSALRNSADVSVTPATPASITPADRRVVGQDVSAVPFSVVGLPPSDQQPSWMKVLAAPGTPSNPSEMKAFTQATAAYQKALNAGDPMAQQFQQWMRANGPQSGAGGGEVVAMGPLARPAESPLFVPPPYVNHPYYSPDGLIAPVIPPELQPPDQLDQVNPAPRPQMDIPRIASAAFPAAPTPTPGLNQPNLPTDLTAPNPNAPGVLTTPPDRARPLTPPAPTPTPPVAAIVAFNNYYSSLPTGATYTDPQGNVRQKRGTAQMVA